VNKQLIFKDTKINYTITGSGNVIVFLHGFLENLTMWNKFSDVLSKTNKIIAIDLPGFGNSEIISNNHSMNMMAEVVFAIIEYENISKCIIVGHSMGGYVALAFAKLFEDKLFGIVLFHSHAAADDDETKTNRNKTIHIVERNHAKFISGFIPSLFAEENIIKFSSQIQEIVNSSLQTKNDGIIAALAGMRDREDNQKLLTKLNIPVLFIVGKEDSRIPLEKIIQQIDLPKVSKTLILDNVGHMGFIEAQEQTCSAVAKFVIKYSIDK